MRGPLLLRTALATRLATMVSSAASTASAAAPSAASSVCASASLLEASLSKLVPPLLASAHKGQGGRVGVFGGSSDYTGAPYFAAASTLRVGADLAYVLTADSAAQGKSCCRTLITLWITVHIMRNAI
jgi:NAD(P)H-hydrate repair Nnr-like enzyme with NAD(P)H-hydrate dehydratase domain